MTFFKQIKQIRETLTQVGEFPREIKTMPHITVADSTNALTDFDMCLAISQKAINSQLDAAWRTWKEQQILKSKNQSFKNERGLIEVVEVDEDNKLILLNLYKFIDEQGKLQDSDLGFKAVLEPLTVNLNVEKALRGQVGVTMNLKSLQGHYFSEGKGGIRGYEFPECSVSFVSDIGRESVDYETLARIDPKAAETASNLFKSNTLSDSVFSIEYLFLKLSDVDLILNSNTHFGSELDNPNVASSINAKLSLLFEKDLSQFMFGTVVRQNKQETNPTFALTDFIFDIHAEPKNPEICSLNYLGMFSGHELPEGQHLDDALLKVNDAWLKPGMGDGQEGLVAGTMAIRRDLFLKEFLIPSFEKALRAQARQFRGIFTSTSENGDFKFSLLCHKGHEKKDFLKHSLLEAYGYTLTLSPVPETNTMRLQGKVNCSMSFKSAELIGNETVSVFESEGNQFLSGTLMLIPEGIGTDFEISPDLEYSFTTFSQKPPKVEGLANLSEALSEIPKWLGLTEKSLVDMMEGNVQSMTTALSSNLNNVLADLDIKLNQQAFIPPGGGVFTFENLRFSNQTGDLLLDVIYQAP